MKKRNFQSKALRVGGYSVMATAIVLIIAILVNVLAGALPASWTQLDLTVNQLLEISEQTRTVVGALETQVDVYWLVRGGAEDVRVEALLQRYEELSSQLHVTKKDPEVNPAFVEQYVTGDYSDNCLIVVSGDRHRYVSNAEIFVYNYDNYFYTGEVDITFEGEAALTGAIAYVTNEELPKIYTLTGHGETALPESFQNAVAKQNMEIADLSLLTVDAVPEDGDCVMIYGPASDISETEKEMLLTYLGSGGSLFLIADPAQDEAGYPNLEALMESYGVTAQKGILVEGDRNHYGLGYPYCLLPDLQAHTITQPLIDGSYKVMLPIAQGLNVAQTLPDGVTVTKLLTTSEKSYSKTAGYAMTTSEKEEGDVDGPFAAAVAIADSNTDAHIVYVASVGLTEDQADTQVSGGNQDFFVNALGWMCEFEQSISIHSKSLKYEYLSIDSSTVAVMTVLVIGIIPLSYLAVGLFVFIRRKRR